MSFVKTPKGEEIYLPKNCIPAHTGQGLTKKQLSFFKSGGKGMQAIANYLFNGDYWAANNFQNKFLADAVLKIEDGGIISLIDWDKPPIYIDKKDRIK